MIDARADLEEEILEAEEAVTLAEMELEEAEERLSNLEQQLAALPLKGGDAELFYARRDPRQISLSLPIQSKLGRLRK